MNDEEKTKPPKTKATQQAVFAYCDLLASQGFRGDFYKELAKHFGAGQGTVGPHFQAWKAGRPNADEWMMTDAAQAIVQEFTQKIWGETCNLAQSKLAVSLHDLNTKLRSALAVGSEYEKSSSKLSDDLVIANERAIKDANDALEIASELKQSQDELTEARKVQVAHKLLLEKYENLQAQLRDTERQLDRLQGKYEAMLEKRGDV